MSISKKFSIYSVMEQNIHAYIEAGVEKLMETYTGILFIVGILAVVLLIGVFKSRAEWVVNFILRGISGMLIIYFVNFLFADRMPYMEMGYNAITFLTSAVLGVPGVAVLYGINLYMML